MGWEQVSTQRGRGLMPLLAAEVDAIREAIDAGKPATSVPPVAIWNGKILRAKKRKAEVAR